MNYIDLNANLSDIEQEAIWLVSMEFQCHATYIYIYTGQSWGWWR